VSPVAWDDEIDAVLAGDLTAALGYRTPAGGVVVQAVAPIGMRGREKGTVGFTTSLGFSKKLERIAVWPDLRCAGARREIGEPRPEAEPGSQKPPTNGTGPRVDGARPRRRLAKTPHHLAGFAGADGRPVVVPVTIGAASDGGLELSSPMLVPGARRAGLLGHRYEPRLIGLETRQYTGWLDATRYAPHTKTG
jgi:hypothetical protein